MPPLPSRSKAEILDRDFLDVRSRVLDLAAALDRQDRANRSSSEHPDPRLAQLRQALEALLEPGPGRAETVQRIFSLNYDPEWLSRIGLSKHPAGR
jgi:hypothetical protein